VSWEDKIDRAVFTGNMKTSPNRQTIYKFGEHLPELFFVNEVYIKTNPPSCFEINEPNVTQGGVLSKRCGLSFPEVYIDRYIPSISLNICLYIYICSYIFSIYISPAS